MDKDSWWASMRKRYTDEEIRQMQSENGSLGGSAQVKKGLAKIKEQDPLRFEEIHRKALAARRAKKLIIATQGDLYE